MNRLKALGTIVFLLAGFSLQANAQAGKFKPLTQCVDLNGKQAEAVLSILEQNHKSNKLFVVDKYCESCFDNYPKPIVVEHYAIKNKKTKTKTQNILINDKPIDIAYLYVNGENVAKKVDCKTIAVSAYLD